MIILGIESSCDETGMALYKTGEGLLANVLSSQTKIHNKYGGVVPELASRDHVKKLVPLLDSLLNKQKLSLDKIGLIAFTNGPGLLGPLLTGAAFAKTLAWINNIRSIEIDHLEAHIFSAMISEKTLEPPFISLLVSGGHTLISKIDKHNSYEIIGKSLDDSAGEVFDKVARKMGLKYPGGPEISIAAKRTINSKYKFPRPMINSNDLNFSFSGLKTHVIREIERTRLNDQIISEISFDFQESIIDVLIHKSISAAKIFDIPRIAVSGGVSANMRLRERFEKESQNIDVFFPNLEFSTDNGAMIAYLGYLKSNETKMNSLKIQPIPTSSVF